VFVPVRPIEMPDQSDFQQNINKTVIFASEIPKEKTQV
jgi:hypothetical protein